MGSNFTSWVFSPVAYDINQPLLIDAATPDHSLSFLQLRIQVRQVVAGLKAIGILPGDCVCVNAFNDVFYSVLYLGIIGAGAIFTGVNPAYSTHEIAHHINTVSAKLLIVEPPMLDKTVAAAESCGVPRSRILLFKVERDSESAEFQSWESLFQHGESDFVTIDPDVTVASYQTTSGTSGLPKAAMIPHSYLVHQAQLRITDSTSYEARRLTALPPMHVFATPIVPSSIRQGAPTYIMRRYDSSSFIKAIADFQITEMWLAPPPIIAIPKSHEVSKTTMQSLRQIWFGGAGVTYENRLPFYDLLHPDARINPVWGMTEVGWVTAVCWPKKQTDDSIGSPLGGFRVRIVADDGRIMHDKGEIGEIQILAPYPMHGYLNNDFATGEAFTIDLEGRWVNSGDIGYINDDGDVFIVDRKKDLIKVRGWQVSPAEVESRIQQHPEVIDVGVIGIALSGGEGEVVCAYVVRHAGSCRQVAAEDIQKFAQVTLAKYKCPDEIIFADTIPRNPTGKILRRLLRDQAVCNLDVPKVQTAATGMVSKSKFVIVKDFSLVQYLVDFLKTWFAQVVQRGSKLFQH